MEIEQILQSNQRQKILPLFQFNLEDSEEVILLKFGLWARYFFPKYFKDEDALFHAQMDLFDLRVYTGSIRSFTNIAFRNAAKTTRTKLFYAFCIANDKSHFRKYIKVLAKDLPNAKQFVTDVYNVFMNPLVSSFYPEVFAKTEFKREETMQSFTTATSIKVTAGTVGMDQRGNLAEDSRPDVIIFEDFETRNSLRSAVETQTIWNNMEEARTGLAKNGSCIYNCNYISERGNVHKLVEMGDEQNVVLITPIIADGVPTWSIYTPEQIEQLKKETTDFAGEYLCQPSAGADILFDREILKKMEARPIIKELTGFKMFDLFDPSHRYALGSDVGGGVSLDSSTSVVIDFSTIPCRVAATYKNNEIKPDVFGYELIRQGELYGSCLVAPEKNNHGHATIAILKQGYNNIHETRSSDTKKRQLGSKEYGWHTNGATKPKMLLALKKAIDDGLIVLSDKDLIKEAMSYTRDDLMDNEVDPRLSTRHFDLLMACAIAWQMKDFAEITEDAEKEQAERMLARLRNSKNQAT